MKKHLMSFGLFCFIYPFVLLLLIVSSGCFQEDSPETPSQATASHFRVIFQNENEMGSVRASSGICQDIPEGTLIIDDQGEGWRVNDDLTEGTNVIMLLTDNNTNEYNDDSIIALIEVVQ